MGQSASQPEQGPDSHATRRHSLLRRQTRTSSVAAEDGNDELLNSIQHSRSRSPSPENRHRFSQLFRRHSTRVDRPESASEHSRGSEMVQRTRSTLRDILRRDSINMRRSERHSGNDYPNSTWTSILPRRMSHVQPRIARDPGGLHSAPRLPSIELTSSLDNDSFVPSDDIEAFSGPSNSSRRSNLRFNPLRHDRPFRHFTSSLRRRRSPQISESSRRNVGSEDQATMLSRLLSVAAAATAATLMGDDHHALSEARSLTAGTRFGELGSAGEDGSFDGFLRALQNGRIASALRQGNETDESQEGPLNFFRMFRFGPSDSTASDTIHSTGLGDPSEASDAGEGRMVPIIIVGIRSISPNSGSSSPEELPPFIDALGNFPSPLPAHALGTHGHDSIDSILRPPQNGTSFRHRRRASMGGFGMGRNRISDRLDDQRDHRSPDRRRERPWSVASSSSNNEPRPPPVTPASPSPEMSRISSRNGTPSHSRPASFIANSIRDLGDSRRNSVLNRLSGIGALSAHSEESVSLRSAHSSDNLLSQHAEPESFRIHAHRRSDTAPDVHFPRFASGHPRRNGVVEPDHLPPLSRSSTSNVTDSSTNNNIEGRGSNNDSRSWIIYVLGGSYPENHPLLTTPSLFTENPTYEDMMLLSALLGPAKAPVATDEDIQSAGGIYNIQPSSDTERSMDAAKTAHLVAVATECSERVELETGQRCLVCLCDFEVEEVARKLVKCNHLFHKECIDQWLTQGRNSCPLCRGQGVDEKETSTTTHSSTDTTNEEAVNISGPQGEVSALL